MYQKISRRLTLKYFSLLALFGVGSPGLAAAAATPRVGKRLDNWHKTHDRVFLGGELWANPMEDWHVADGWAECRVSSGNRSIHSLTHQIADTRRPFSLSVRLAKPERLSKDGGAGFRIGVRSDIDEVKSNCFADGGLNAGIVGDRLVLGSELKKLDAAFTSGECVLVLTGSPGEGDQLLSRTDRHLGRRQIARFGEVLRPNGSRSRQHRTRQPIRG